MDIIVVGGSLGGLFAAVAAKRTGAGHNIRILERNKSRLHDQGAGIVMGDDTGDFFRRFDDTQRTMAVESPYRQYLERSGEVKSRDHWVQRMTSWDLLYNILRYNFDGDCEQDYLPSSSLNGSKNGHSGGSSVYSLGCAVQSLRESTSPETGKTVMEVTYTDANGATQTATADLVLGADGPSSTIRSLVDPSSTREYAGYSIWRGTLPELDVTSHTSDTVVEKFTFFHAPAIQMLSYVIPGEKGAVQRGQRLINWAWYYNYPADSPEFKELMTDSDGKTHRITLPVGKVDPKVWEKQKECAQRVLPPQFAELVCKTQQPFVQAVTDVISRKSSYFDGKVLLIGDALAGFRPHTAASTSQAAFDSILLHEMLKGEINLTEWERQTMEYATEVQQKGVLMGQRSQFSDHPMACAPGGR